MVGRQSLLRCEIVQVVNAILRQDPEARRRQLFVRTYSVIPLQAQGGLIEWVPNLVPYRYGRQSAHRRKGAASDDARRVVQQQAGHRRATRTNVALVPFGLFGAASGRHVRVVQVGSVVPENDADGALSGAASPIRAAGTPPVWRSRTRRP